MKPIEINATGNSSKKNRTEFFSRDHSPPQGSPMSEAPPGKCVARSGTLKHRRFKGDALADEISNEGDKTMKARSSDRNLKSNQTTNHTQSTKGVTSMKHRTILMLGTFLFLIGAVSQMALATGTLAGTPITNQATVSFVAGSNTRSATSNTVTLYVAQTVTINYSPANSSSGSSVDGTTIYRAFTIVNNSNGTDNFTLTTPSVPTGWTAAIYHDQGTVGTFDVSDVLTGSTGSMIADASYNVIVAITIPFSNTNAVDGNSYNVVLRATSTAVNAGNIVVANLGQTGDYTATVNIQKPVVTMGVVTVEPSPKIPGADFSFTLTVQNTGSGAVSGTSTLTYTLPADFKYVGTSPTTLGNGVVLTYNPSGSYGGTLVMTVPAGLLAAAPTSAFTIPFTAEIQQISNNGSGPLNSASITSAATDFSLSYNDGATSKTQGATSSSGFGGAFTVSTASGVSMTVASATQTGNPGADVDYQLTLTNAGNHSDGFTFSQAQNGGNWNTAHTFSLTQGGASITSVTGLAAGGVQNIWVRVTVDANATDTQTIVRDLTATTQTSSPVAPTGGSTASTKTVTTTVTAPQLSVTLDTLYVSGGTSAKNPVPGSVIRYTVTITNTGSGTATSISSSNTGFAHLTSNLINVTSFEIDATGSGTFTAQSLPYSNAGITASVSSGVLTVTFPSIPNGENRKYRYNTTVQ